MPDLIDRLRSVLSDRYSMECEIGRGGMATVFVCRDLRHDRDVALKVLHPQLAAALGPDRFLREIQISARLNHPHILTLIDSGEADGLLYYVMPYVEGESLRARLDREGELPVGDAVRILRDVSDALAYAHEHGVVHRDVKPDNVLLSGRHALVTDFGVAKAVSEATGRQELTTAGVAIGTPVYMAPEQASADPNVDHRADIYAVGVMAYEMLSGQPPFHGGTPQQILSAHITEAPTPVVERRRNAPPEIASLTMRCLEKKAADRWQSAEELLQHLEGMVTPISGTQPVRAVRRPNILTTVGVAAAAVVVLLTAIVLLLNRGGDQAATSPTKFAVIPFAPTTPDTALTRLGKDLVVLLSANMDGVGDITTVDASAIAGQGLTRGRPYTLEEGAELARSFGAGRVVFGSLVRVGDEVRVDAALTTTDGLETVARASVSAAPEAVGVLADSLTWGLLRQIWSGDVALAPRLTGDLTHSYEALRAFLQGERALVEGRWPAAWEAYERAIAADSTFWLAYWRYRSARTWMVLGTPHEFAAAWEADSNVMLAALPERERLLREAAGAATRREAFRQLETFTRRYPDYYPGWMLYADRLLHGGGLVGYSLDDAIVGFERVVELNPVFVPAWEHLAFATLFVADTLSFAQAVAALERLGGRQMIIDGYGYDELQLLESLSGVMSQRNWGGALVDSLSSLLLEARMATGLDFHAMASSLVTLALPALQLEVSAEIRRRAGSSHAASVFRRGEAFAWAARGAWDSAVVAMDRYARNFEDEETALLAYRFAATAEWLGGLSPGQADQYREAAVAQTTSDIGIAEIAWLDGIRSVPEGDIAGLRSARARLRSQEYGWAAAYEQSLEAFELAANGLVDSAAQLMAAHEWAKADSSGWSRTMAVNRLAASDWLVETGDTAQAVRLGLWSKPGTVSVGFHDMLCLMIAPTYLQRARIEEGLGQRDRAEKHYREFLRLYDMPTEGLRHLVEEAETALARLANIEEVVRR